MCFCRYNAMTKQPNNILQESDHTVCYFKLHDRSINILKIANTKSRYYICRTNRLELGFDLKSVLKLVDFDVVAQIYIIDSLFFVQILFSF